MKRKTPYAVLAVVVGIAAGAALAALEGDANGDGLLSYPEMTLLHPKMTRTLFGQIDANGDSLVDVAERDAAIADGLIEAQ